MDVKARTNSQFSGWHDEAKALVSALEARGLVAKIFGHGAVGARNSAGEPDQDDARGQALSPGLQQEVWCRPYGPDDALWWHWTWMNPDRNVAPDLEPLCPLSDTETAADRIRHVLAVPSDGTPG